MQSENKFLFNKAVKKMPVIGILRDIPLGQEKECVRTSVAQGLTLIEVTMNTKNAIEILKALKEASKGTELVVGAGTVRTLEELNLALDAGAGFIVSPTTIPEIIEKGNSLGIPMIPGALTPTEIEIAYRAGATCVKVFPVDALGGPSYIKSLRGPFRDIPLLACGGVHTENAKTYLDASANLLAFGGSIFKPSLMNAGKWDEIGKNLKEFLIATSCA